MAGRLTTATVLLTVLGCGSPVADLPVTDLPVTDLPVNDSPPSTVATAEIIQQIMTVQADAWNAGDIETFVQPYWQSPELTFSSGGETTRGYQQTLERYREKYPTPEAMGKLTFSHLDVTPLGDSAALVLGRWHLDRSQPIGGNFSLVFRRIEGQWRIIHDHSSALSEKK